MRLILWRLGWRFMNLICVAGVTVRDFPLTNLAISDTAISTRAAKIVIMTNKSPIKLPVSATRGPASTER